MSTTKNLLKNACGKTILVMDWHTFGVDTLSTHHRLKKTLEFIMVLTHYSVKRVDWDSWDIGGIVIEGIAPALDTMNELDKERGFIWDPLAVIEAFDNLTDMFVGDKRMVVYPDER